MANNPQLRNVFAMCIAPGGVGGLAAIGEAPHWGRGWQYAPITSKSGFWQVGGIVATCRTLTLCSLFFST